MLERLPSYTNYLATMDPINCPICGEVLTYDDEPFQCWGFTTSCLYCKGSFMVVRSVPQKMRLKLLGTPHVIYKEKRKRRANPKNQIRMSSVSKRK